MPVTRAQAEQIAQLAAASRPHGARRWDIPGIVAAIGKVQHLALADVAMAALRGASDRSLDTPGAIANTGSSCWRERLSEPGSTRRPFDRQRSCQICGFEREDCARRWAKHPTDSHEFEPIGSDPGRLPRDQTKAVVDELRDIARPAPTTSQEPPTGGSSASGGHA